MAAGIINNTGRLDRKLGGDLCHREDYVHISVSGVSETPMW